MSDDETIGVYDKHVQDYAELVLQDEADPILTSFIKRIPENGYVLDLGCGPANASAIMRDHGLRVDPVDASEEMVKLANETHAINARRALFSDLNSVETYDGIWANFSLLHAPIAEFPDHLTAIYNAIITGGIFHIALKLGNGMERDRMGRLYSYYSEEELSTHLTNAGFSILAKTNGEGKGLAGDVSAWIAILSKR
jgi:trans-aconitate methyltransferase